MKKTEQVTQQKVPFAGFDGTEEKRIDSWIKQLESIDDLQDFLTISANPSMILKLCLDHKNRSANDISQHYIQYCNNLLKYKKLLYSNERESSIYQKLIEHTQLNDIITQFGIGEIRKTVFERCDIDIWDSFDENQDREKIKKSNDEYCREKIKLDLAKNFDYFLQKELSNPNKTIADFVNEKKEQLQKAVSQLEQKDKTINDSFADFMNELNQLATNMQEEKGQLEGIINDKNDSSLRDLYPMLFYADNSCIFFGDHGTMPQDNQEE